MDQKVADILENKVNLDYSCIADAFSDTRQIIWKDLVRFKDFVKNGDTVLDYGCGNGRLVELFKDLDISYLGVDPCQKLIQKATEKYGSEKYIFKKLKKDDILRKGQFSVVFSISVIQHIPSKERQKEFLSFLASKVKPGGYLFLVSWNLWQKKYRSYVFEYMRKKLFCQSLTKEIGQKVNASKIDWKDTFIPFQDKVYRYVHAFTKKELLILAKSGGLEIKEAYYSKEEKKVFRFQGKNIILILQKPI